MGSMKELITQKADEVALDKYDREFYQLTTEQQDEVWKLAEQAGQDYLAAQIDAARERSKYGKRKSER